MRKPGGGALGWLFVGGLGGILDQLSVYPIHVRRDSVRQDRDVKLTYTFWRVCTIKELELLPDFPLAME